MHDIQSVFLWREGTSFMFKTCLVYLTNNKFSPLCMVHGLECLLGRMKWCLYHVSISVLCLMFMTKCCHDSIEIEIKIVIQNLWHVQRHIGHVNDDFSILFGKIIWFDLTLRISRFFYCIILHAGYLIINKRGAWRSWRLIKL